MSFSSSMSSPSSTSSSPQSPCFLTSLDLDGWFSREDASRLGQEMSTHLPLLGRLHLRCNVDLSGFQLMSILQDLHCTTYSDTTLADFRTFVSRMPSLSRLDLGTSFMPEGWGPAIASSCPHLTSLSLHPWCYSYIALRSLALTSLSLR
jgi:hypothetical protein